MCVLETGVALIKDNPLSQIRCRGLPCVASITVGSSDRKRTLHFHYCPKFCQEPYSQNCGVSEIFPY